MLSGNPGYLNGAPLLAGTVASTGGAISRLPGGLPLLTTAPDGTCTPTADPRPLLFGANTRAACSVRFSLAALRQFCQSTTVSGSPTDVGQLAMHFSGLPGKTVFLGKWGNSDVADARDWIQLERETAGTKLLLVSSAVSWAGLLEPVLAYPGMCCG
jgi:hypothetical protein